MKRVITIIVVVLVVLAAIGYVLTNNKKKAQETTDFIAKGSGAVAVKTADVERKEVNLDFTANGNKSEQSKAVGKAVAEKAIAAGVKEVVFDRNGYLYHGRVKSLAEGAREAGLVF